MEAKAKSIAEELKNRLENQSIESPWYTIAVSLALIQLIQTCAFTAANYGPGVSQVYLTAIEGRAPDEARIILRRIKEALLKGCMLFGVPKMLNAFYPLAKVIPGEEYVDLLNVREDVKNPLDMTDRGLAVFKNIYREDYEPNLEPYKIAPEISTMSSFIG